MVHARKDVINSAADECSYAFQRPWGDHQGFGQEASCPIIDSVAVTVIHDQVYSRRFAKSAWREPAGEGQSANATRHRIGDRRIHYDVAAVDFRHVVWPRNRSYGDRGQCDSVERRNVT